MHFCASHVRRAARDGQPSYACLRMRKKYKLKRDMKTYKTYYTTVKNGLGYTRLKRVYVIECHEKACKNTFRALYPNARYCEKHRKERAREVQRHKYQKKIKRSI